MGSLDCRRRWTLRGSLYRVMPGRYHLAWLSAREISVRSRNHRSTARVEYAYRAGWGILEPSSPAPRMNRMLELTGPS